MITPSLIVGDKKFATKDSFTLGYKKTLRGSYIPKPFDVVRASTGTFTGSDGLVQTALDNVARVDYSDNDFIELEPESINICLQSEEFDTSWGINSRGVINSNQTISPTGTLTADEFEKTTDSNESQLVQIIAVVAGIHTYSVHFKNNVNSEVPHILIWDNGSNGVRTWYNLNSGTIGSNTSFGTTFSITDSSITDVGNGWFRCSLSVDTGAGTTFKVGNCHSRADGQANDSMIGDKLYTWGAQVSPGTVLTRYVPTTTIPAGIPPLYSEYEVKEPESINLFLHSEDFNDAYWNSNVRISIVSDNIISPDGTLNADKVIATNTSGSHAIQRQTLSVNFGLDYTYSVFAKKGEYNYIALLIDNPNTGKYFDLENGIILGDFLGAPNSSKIEDFGNGWFRCSISYTAIGTTPTTGIYLSEDINDFTFQGDDVSGVYIWGAQLSPGSVLTRYAPTTTVPVTLPTLFSNNRLKGALLLEPESENLCIQSEDFSTWVLNSNITRTANVAVSPDGALSAYLVEDIGSGDDFIQATHSGATASAAYISGMHFKFDTSEFISVFMVSIGDTTITSLVTVKNDGTIYSANTPYKLEVLPNGWYRLSVEITTPAGTPDVRLRIYPSYTDGTTTTRVNGATGAVIVWGAQIELGSLVTSYIPTSGSTVTREQDVITGGGSVNDFNSEEGVFFIEIAALKEAGTTDGISIDQGDNQNRVMFRWEAGADNVVLVQVRENNNSVWHQSKVMPFVVTDFHKFAISWKDSEFRFVAGGVLQKEQLSGGTPPAGTLNEIDMAADGFMGKIRQLKVFKSAMTEAELIKLTS